jgi:hypothetical protein
MRTTGMDSYLAWLGEHPEEAIAEIRRAVELDPLNLRFNTNVGQALWLARQRPAGG